MSNIDKEEKKAKKRKKEKVKVNKWKLPKEEAKLRAREKKVRRALRVARLRPLKNFFYWFFGVLSSVGIVFGAIFVGVKVVPISTYVGKDTLGEYVSEDITNKSFLDAILGINEYDFDDFPIIDTLLKDALGEGNEISVFNEYQEVRNNPTLDENYKLPEGSGEKPENFYYIETTSEPSPMAESSEPKYAKAFGEDGALKAELRDAYKKGELKLFLPPLLDLPVLEGLSSITKYLDYFKVTDILRIAGMEEGVMVFDIMQGIYIGDFMKPVEEGGFSAESLLNNVSLETLGGTEMLGDLGNFKFFSEYEKVPADKYPVVAENGGKEFITKEGEGEDAKFTSEPKLYYVLVAEGNVENGTESVYAPAFTEEGEFITKYDNNGAEVIYANLAEVKAADKLCYANLAKTPFSSALNLISESIGRQQIVDLISGFGMEVEEDSIIKKLFDGETVESFGKSPEEGGFDVNGIELSALLGEYTTEGEDKNSDLYDMLLAITGEKPSRSEFNSDEDYNNALKEKANGLTLSSLTEGFEFDSIQLSAILGEYTTEGDDKNDELYDILLAITGDKPKRSEFNSDEEYNTALINAANALTLSSLTDGFEFGGIELSMILGEYTTEGEDKNSDLYDMLLAITGDKPNRSDYISDEDYNNALKEAANALTVDSLTEGFNIDGVKISDIIDGLDDKTLELLCSSINANREALGGTYEEVTKDNLTVGDFADFSVDYIKLSSVLEPPTAEFPDRNKTIYDILLDATGADSYEDISIKSLSSGEFDIDNVKIVTVLGEYEGNEKLYDIILSANKLMPPREAGDTDEAYTAKVKVEAEKLTVANLSGLETNDILLTTVLPKTDDNAKLYDILTSAIAGKTSDTLTVGDLSSFNPDNILLNSVLPEKDNTVTPAVDNTKLYEILTSAIAGSNKDTLKVGDLNKFNSDNIKLSAVLKVEDNEKLYDILCSAITGATNDTLTVGQLNGFNPDNILLKSVLPITDETVTPAVDNTKLYEILTSAIAGSNKDTLKVGDLNKFNSDNIKLKVVLPTTGNEKLYDILCSAITGVTNDTLTVGDLNKFSSDNIKLSVVLKVDENEKLYDILEQATLTDRANITISSLSSFDVANVTLGTALPRTNNENIYKIFDDAIGENAENTKLSEINGKLNIDDIKLSTVLGSEATGNSIIDALVSDGVTVGGISTAINNLSLYEIYGESCFEKVTAGTGNFTRSEEAGVVTYTRTTGAGDYNINTTSGIWILLCLEANVDSITGQPTKYVSSTTTMQTLQDNGSDIGKIFLNATIYQLKEVGLITIENLSPMVAPLTIKGVIEQLNDMLG